MRFNIWKDCPKVPITELLSFIVDNRGKTVPTADDGWKLIATNCVTNNTLFPVYEKVRYLTQETYETWFRAHPMPGDILFVNKGTPGRVCLVPDPVDFCIAQDMIALRADDEKIYNKYLFAVLRSREIQQQIYNTNVGDVIPHFKKQFMDQLLIPVPDRRIQEIIGNLYYELSYKTELNKKINKNLEQQADAIYQSFFSPKSGIQGKRVTLDEYCSIFTGKKNANASVDGGKYKFFTCAPDALQIDSYIYDGNAIIISGNGAYTGRTRFYSGRFDLYQRTYACTLLDGINPDYIFPLYWFVKLKLSKKIMGGTRGSAIPYIVMNDLAKFEFIYSDEMFDTYIPIFKSLTESIHVNELENEHLSNLRDTLLPQLMSGELDVSDINL